MKTIITLILAAGAFALTGCSDHPDSSKASSQKSAIESVFAQGAKLRDEQFAFMSGERLAGLMAIDVQSCPADVRAAWFDYLVEIHALHTRMERVIAIAMATGKPVKDLTALITFAAGNPALGPYLLSALGKVDEAKGRLERAAMNYNVMPKIETRASQRPDTRSEPAPSAR